MTTRASTTSLIAGKTVAGNRGLGVTGAVIRSTTNSGTNGPGLIYPSLDGSVDDTKEYFIRIKSAPSSGNLFVYEDGSFILSGASNGTYTIITDLYENGINLGEIRFPITIGSTIQLINDISFNYNIRTIISKLFDSSYIVQNIVSKTLNCVFNINTQSNVIGNLIVIYQILQQIGSNDIIITLPSNDPITIYVK